MQRFWINIRRIFSRSVSTVKIRTAFVSFRLLLLAVSFQETKFLKSKIRSALSARSKRLMHITRFKIVMFSKMAKPRPRQSKQAENYSIVDFSK